MGHIWLLALLLPASVCGKIGSVVPGPNSGDLVFKDGAWDPKAIAW